MLIWDAVVARHLSEQMEGGWAGLQYPFVCCFVDDYTWLPLPGFKALGGKERSWCEG
jgi:hypothetical protein